MAWRKQTPLTKLKAAVTPRGTQSRAILTGPFRGIRLQLDLQSESQMYLGLYEREIYRDIRILSKGVRSIVDIGAAEGALTLYGLIKTGAERIIAFEPNRETIAKFQHNLKLNGCEKNCRLEFHTEFLGEADGPGVVSADAVASRILSPCLLKMDVEGVEAAVLRGSASRLLALPGLRFLIETHGRTAREECEAILRAANYTTRYVEQAWWRIFLPELRGTGVGWLIATN